MTESIIIIANERVAKLSIPQLLVHIIVLMLLLHQTILHSFCAPLDGDKSLNHDNA